MLSPLAPSSSRYQIARKHKEVKAEQKSPRELSCPSTFRCSSLMLIPWRCQTKTNQEVLYAKARKGRAGRKGQETWEGERGQKVLWMSVVKERVKETKKGEWGVSKWRAWLETGYVGLKDRREGGGEVVLEEIIQWRWGCISSMSQANYSAAAAFLYLSPALPLFVSSPFTFFHSPSLTLSLSLLQLSMCCQQQQIPKWYRCALAGFIFPCYNRKEGSEKR